MNSPFMVVPTSNARYHCEDSILLAHLDRRLSSIVAYPIRTCSSQYMGKHTPHRAGSWQSIEALRFGHPTKSSKLRFRRVAQKVFPQKEVAMRKSPKWAAYRFAKKPNEPSTALCPRLGPSQPHAQMHLGHTQVLDQSLALPSASCRSPNGRSLHTRVCR